MRSRSYRRQNTHHYPTLAPTQDEGHLFLFSSPPSQPTTSLAVRRAINRTATANTVALKNTAFITINSISRDSGLTKFDACPLGGGIAGKFHMYPGMPPGPVGSAAAGVVIAIVKEICGSEGGKKVYDSS